MDEAQFHRLTIHDIFRVRKKEKEREERGEWRENRSLDVEEATSGLFSLEETRRGLKVPASVQNVSA